MILFNFMFVIVVYMHQALERAPCVFPNGGFQIECIPEFGGDVLHIGFVDPGEPHPNSTCIAPTVFVWFCDTGLGARVRLERRSPERKCRANRSVRRPNEDDRQPGWEILTLVGTFCLGQMWQI